MADTRQTARRAKGEGSVFWNADAGRWQGLIDLGYGADGRRNRKKVSAKTKVEVVKRLKELRLQVDGGVNVQSADQTLGAHLDSWTAGLEAARRLRPTTVQGYQWIVGRYVTPELRAIPLRKVTPQVLRAWLAGLATLERKRPLSNRTIHLAHVVVGAALKQARRDGLIINNPMDAVDGPGQGEALEPKSLTANQAAVLLRAGGTDPLADTFITLALGCGLRRGEAIGLQWDDVFLNAHPPMLTVRRSVAALAGHRLVQSPKTRAGRRQVIIPDFTLARLHSWHTQQLEQRLAAGPAWQGTEPDWVLTSSTGTAMDPDNLSKRVVAVGKSVGMKLSPHALRHTYVIYSAPDAVRHVRVGCGRARRLRVSAIG